jgi:hypothetical protein
MQAPAKRATKKAAATGLKMVLGYTSRGARLGDWDVMFVPQGKVEAIQRFETVPGARWYRLEGMENERAALREGRRRLKVDLEKLAAVEGGVA